MAFLAAATPWVASAVGSMLPAIVDAFRSGKSPEEAQRIIAPERQALVERLVGSGMQQSAAEAMADESMADEIAQAQLPEPMNPWLTAALGIGGAIGGWKLGKMAGNRLSPPVAPSPETPTKTSKPRASRKKAVEEPKSPPTPEELALAQSGGLGPFPVKPAGHVKNPLIRGVPQADMAEMLAGGPFPS